MGKTKKKKQPELNGDNQKQPLSSKRKQLPDEDVPPKRLKQENGWFPGKFVLLKKPEDKEKSEEEDQVQPQEQNNNKKMKVKKTNGSTKSSKKSSAKSQLQKVFEKYQESEEDDDYSEEEAEDEEDFSDEDLEECSEEWSTDTDYEMEDEFHSEDGEEVETDSECCGGEYESEDDSDFVPDIEDKYVKAGEAVLYDAKGLDLAFGNSEESQIIDISDVQPAMLEDCQDEEVPQLDSGPEPEEAMRDLKLEDDDEVLKCSNLASIASFKDDDDGVTVNLRGTLHFHGVLTIKSITDEVQINGYVLSPGETVTVPSISKSDYFLNLTPVNGSATVYLQQAAPDTDLNMLKTYSFNPLLPSRKMLLTNSPCPSSELRLSTKFFNANENPKINAFQVNEQWNFLELASNSRLTVVGGKNVGKSGLCQFLINKHIKKFGKILLIDLDIGQPICSPAQTVSATLLTSPILGPGYLSKNTPEKCLLFGDKNVMLSPFKYIKCLQQLIQWCRDKSEYNEIPWIINTMGYQKGFGLQLMCLMLKVIQPTDVVQIQHQIRAYNFSNVLTEDFVNNFKFNFFDETDMAGVKEKVLFTTHTLDSLVNSQASDNWTSNATEKRKLSILAHLSRILGGNQTFLNDVTPFQAPINKIHVLIIDEECSSQKASLELLNGNLVYLCSSDGKPTAESILDCHGIGVVRGIDKINEQIFLLLPESAKLESKVNTLAIANIPLPAEILLKQSIDVTGPIPYVTFFKDRNLSNKKYVNKRGIKDCF